MYTRKLPPPDRSFFLFGPRGTGKSTWIRERFPAAKYYDLLRDREFVRLLRDPGLLRAEVTALPKGNWVVIDEVQKLPKLLDEIHSILFEHQDGYRFAMTGSSARKLKRGSANLLAGRAINRSFYPITGEEMDYHFQLDEVLQYGCLPASLSETKASVRIDFLEAYAANYIREEVQQEALVKDLDSFTRFLEVASLMNGQFMNINAISRDAGVTRPSVQGYFDVLVDTLIGFRLPSWRPRAKVKEVQHPKFYLFDPGIVRALAGRLREPLDQTERGVLLETLILHELRSHIAYSGCGGSLSYWRTPSGSEVDFIWTRARHAVGIEVKSSSRWKSEYGYALRVLLEARVLKRAIAVYGGESMMKDGKIDIYPVKKFMRALASGELIG